MINLGTNKSNNFNVLLSIRIIKKAIYLFVDIFVQMYFFEISDNSILPVSLFYIAQAIFIPITMSLCRNVMKGPNRKRLIYLGNVLQVVYLFMFILLKEDMVNYAWLAGVVRGISGGSYFATYNIWEAEGISVDDRFEFVGRYNVLKGILSIVFPTVSGFVIYKLGYSAGVLIVILLTIFSIILSVNYKDSIISTDNNHKTHLVKFLKSAMQDKRYKYALFVSVFGGLTYSDGAFTTLILLYTIKVYSNSLSLGVITTVVNVLTIVFGFIIKKILRNRASYSIVSSYILLCLNVVAFVLMIVNPSYITIPLFKLSMELHYMVCSVEDSVSYNHLINKSEFMRGFTEEYMLFNEYTLVVSRVLGFVLLIAYYITGIDYIVYMFMLFVVGWTITLSKVYGETFN